MKVSQDPETDNNRGPKNGLTINEGVKKCVTPDDDG